MLIPVSNYLSDKIDSLNKELENLDDTNTLRIKQVEALISSINRQLLNIKGDENNTEEENIDIPFFLKEVKYKKVKKGFSLWTLSIGV